MPARTWPGSATNEAYSKISRTARPQKQRAVQQRISDRRSGVPASAADGLLTRRHMGFCLVAKHQAQP